MNKRIALSLLLLVAPSLVQAAAFSKKCPDVRTCAHFVSRLLDQKYVFDKDLKGNIQVTDNLEVTAQNAELLFTSMLNINGYSRIPGGEKNTFQILRQRDARDQPLPLISANRKQPPKLPNNWDLHTMKYKATHVDAVKNIARTCRSFMPANSRIIPEEVAGMLLVTDTALNLKKLYAIIVDLDRKPSAALKKRWEEARKARLKRQK